MLLWNLLPSSSGYKKTQATGSYKIIVPIYWTKQSDNLYASSHSCLSSLHCKSWCKSQMCVLQVLFHKSECMCTHACRNAHTQIMFPSYTQKQISFSHKWYVLKIKNESTYIFLYLICHKLQGHFTGLADLHNTTQKQTTHIQRHIPHHCVFLSCVCAVNT